MDAKREAEAEAVPLLAIVSGKRHATSKARMFQGDVFDAMIAVAVAAAVLHCGLPRLFKDSGTAESGGGL